MRAASYGNPDCLTLPTIPTTVTHRWLNAIIKRRPNGSSPGQYRSAKAWLMRATLGVPAPSLSAMARPRNKGVPSN